MMPITPAEAMGVIVPRIKRAPVPISVVAATRACTWAGWRPRESNHRVVTSRPPGPRTLFDPCMIIMGPMVRRSMSAATSAPELPDSDLDTMLSSMVTPADRAWSVLPSGRSYSDRRPRGKTPVGRSDPDHHLAGVASAEQQVEGIAGMVEPVDDVLAVLDPSFHDPASHPELRLGKAVHVVEDQEALHPGPLDDQVQVVAGSLGSIPVVLGDRTAQHHPGLHGQIGQAGVEDRASHVVEVDVDPVRTGLAEARRHVLIAIVDGVVESQLTGQPGALLGRSGDAHHVGSPTSNSPK